MQTLVRSTLGRASKAGNKEYRKEDAGDGGRARHLQARADQGCFLLHRTLTIAAGNWPFGLLIDVIWWQSPSSNSLVEGSDQIGVKISFKG
jgi:hypothetical protein